MRQVGWIVAIVILLGSGCAKRATMAPSSPPFTNQELALELRRQGVGGAAGAGATAGVEGLPEVRETPRGVIITLPATFFAFDRSDLDAPGRLVVDRISKVLNLPRAANRTIRLEGHTDNVGTAAYNLTLSRNRAESVAKELAKQGMRPERITVEAFGETRPVVPNRKPDGTDDPAGRAKNRRVDAIIPN